MQAQMLAPAAVLIVWSLIILIWVGSSRLSAMKKMGVPLSAAQPGGRGQDLEGTLPPEIMWKSHNYTHLMEQPTIFYAAVVILAIMGAGAIDVVFAWAYVALRVVHSLYQAKVNRVAVRFQLFRVMTLCLAVLAIRAVWVTLLHNPATITG